MNNNEAMECVNLELRKYDKDLISNIHSEIVGSGIYFGSSLSLAYLAQLLSEKIKLEQTIIPALIVPIIITIKNHDIYARSNDVKKNIKFLKELKKEIVKGSNPFENTEKEDFTKTLEQKYNYKNALI